MRLVAVLALPELFLCCSCSCSLLQAAVFQSLSQVAQGRLEVKDEKR